ncbi:MAG: hypothetical protein ACOC0E_13950, partial [Spirochaetota bacterium]
MDRYPDISPAIRENMESKNIDVELSLSILAAFNRGEFDRFEPITVGEMPNIDGSTVIDFTGEPSIALPAATARERL